MHTALSISSEFFKFIGESSHGDSELVPVCSGFDERVEVNGGLYSEDDRSVVRGWIA